LTSLRDLGPEEAERLVAFGSERLASPRRVTLSRIVPFLSLTSLSHLALDRGGSGKDWRPSAGGSPLDRATAALCRSAHTVEFVR
jgi:hypothetical protein